MGAQCRKQNRPSCFQLVCMSAIMSEVSVRHATRQGQAHVPGSGSNLGSEVCRHSLAQNTGGSQIFLVSLSSCKNSAFWFQIGQVYDGNWLWGQRHGSGVCTQPFGQKMPTSYCFAMCFCHICHLQTRIARINSVAIRYDGTKMLGTWKATRKQFMRLGRLLPDNFENPVGWKVGGFGDHPGQNWWEAVRGRIQGRSWTYADRQR